MAGAGAEDAALQIELPHSRAPRRRPVPLTITHGGFSLTDKDAVKLPRRLATHDFAKELPRHGVASYNQALGARTLDVRVEGRSVRVRGNASLNVSAEAAPPKATAALTVSAEVPIGHGATETLKLHRQLLRNPNPASSRRA